MYAWLNRTVLQPLHARRNGSKVFDYLRLLEQTQYDPPATIRLRQWLGVQRLIRHAYATVPYYRRRFDALGLHPSDIREPRDLANIPILTKDDIRSAGRELLSTAFDPAKLTKKKTSGSTGVPLTIFIDPVGLQWKTACTIRADDWSGRQRGRRVAKVWGNPEWRHQGWKGRLRHLLIDRSMYLDTLDITEERLRAFAGHLRRYPPSLLFGHAHSLYMLAAMWKKHGLRRIKPDGIIATAMLLPAWERQVIEEVFETKVTDRYGCEETSLIASECAEHRGFHLNADSLYAEVLPDASLADGAGALLLTDFTNSAMPLIRYKVGDIVVPSSRSCPCGRGLPMFERVQGREADYVLTPTGKLISGISLTENFALLIDGAAQVQIVQEAVTFLRIRMVRDEAFGSRSERQVADLVRNTFGGSMKYELEFVEKIPQERSGKYRFCISKPADEYLRGMSQ